ncbi:MAG: PilZ domain-containing protein [Sterolibacterium sp.]|jgi:hypothetical protein|nr:PilZ domain-containing protein [Sterolibacterium sp.]
MTKPQERRDFWRASFHSPARLTCAAGVACEAQICDLSLKGAMLEMPADWAGEAGSHCRLQLDLSPEITIRMQTTVMHIRGQRVGLRCDEIDIDSITALRRLVELNSGDAEMLERELSLLMQAA